MTDAGSSMSLTAIIVLTVVVLAGMAGWLGAVFFMAREPRGGSARPDREEPGHASQPAADRHPGDVPAAAPASAPGGDGGTGGALTRVGRRR
jgi:hypothetical protein